MGVREVIAVLGAGALAGLGVCAWLAWRRGSGAQVGALGRLSAPTMAVAALSCLGVAYHVLAHTFSWGTLRAPMWIAALVGAGATSLAVLLDLIERRSSGEDETTDGEGA